MRLSGATVSQQCWRDRRKLQKSDASAKGHDSDAPKSQRREPPFSRQQEISNAERRLSEWMRKACMRRCTKRARHGSWIDGSRKSPANWRETSLWKVLRCRPWQREENILLLEARALCTAMQLGCSYVGAEGARMLCLVDNMALCLSVGRSRARKFK